MGRNVGVYGIALILGFLMTLFSASSSPGSDGIMSELTRMSIEELMQIEVTTVSKRSEVFADTPSAIYVITAEDIRRSGATTIAEILRGVPGIQVNRIDSNLWAISARGFNERYSNKLLVMIDGRSVYSPVYSGVYWDVQDTSLEDIERIEIIRGPGGTIWGANAVNGVINIITKDSAESQGYLLSVTGGTEDRLITNLRYGGKVGDDTTYRIFAKYTNRDGFVNSAGDENPDDWFVYRAGFRVDSQLKGGKFTIEGDIYDGNVSSHEIIPLLIPPYQSDSGIDEDISGRSLLARWSKSFHEDNRLTLQAYYDHVKRFQRFDIEDMKEEYHIDTYDLDFTHYFIPFKHHRITWGGGARFINDRIENNSPIRFSPEERDQAIYNIFLQDEIEILPKRVYFTVGTKLEHNDYTGYEWEPSLRIRWRFARNQMLWGAFSRAVRTPSRIEVDGRIDQAVIPDTPPVMLSLIARDDFISEEMYAYELGYRAGVSDNLSVDVACFFNQYDDLRTFEPGEVFLETDPVAHVVYSFNGQNRMYGESYGVETSLRWEPFEWWRITLNYSFLEINLRRDSSSMDTESESLEEENPENQISLISSMDLPADFEVDLMLHYTDRLPAYNIDDYLIANLRVGWRPLKGLSISLVGQNLLDNHHPEIGSKYVSTDTVEIERGVYGKVTWEF